MKMKEVPYYKQESSWTCGPAAMRMVLEHIGIKKTEKQLIKLLETNKIIGTWESQIPKLAEKYKLNYIVERNGKIDDLKKSIKNKFILIVCYYMSEEDITHYAVITKMTSRYIYLHDPWIGPNHKIKLDSFEKTWKSDPIHEKDKRWFIGIKKS